MQKETDPNRLSAVSDAEVRIGSSDKHAFAVDF